MKPVRKIAKDLYRKDGPDGIWWLGNAGFVIRLKERYIFIDPCITEFHEKTNSHPFEGYEWTRLHEFPLVPEDILRADHVLFSHEHSDHLDLWTLPAFVKLRAGIWAPENCQEIIRKEGVPDNLRHSARPGKSFSAKGYTVLFTRTRHLFAGEWYYPGEDQDACGCGFLVKTVYGNIFFPGDTCYLPELESLPVDYLLLPINDTNMGVGPAARLAEKLQPKVVIPCHYGMFSNLPPYAGSPDELRAVITGRHLNLPRTDIVILAPGGKCLFGRK